MLFYGLFHGLFKDFFNSYFRMRPVHTMAEEILDELNQEGYIVILPEYGHKYIVLDEVD